jgi:hypothetical protein
MCRLILFVLILENEGLHAPTLSVHPRTKLAMIAPRYTVLLLLVLVTRNTLYDNTLFVIPSRSPFTPFRPPLTNIYNPLPPSSQYSSPTPYHLPSAHSSLRLSRIHNYEYPHTSVAVPHTLSVCRALTARKKNYVLAQACSSDFCMDGGIWCVSGVWFCAAI